MYYDSSSEFTFSSAFIKTDQVNYDVHISTGKHTNVATINLYMKETPTITVQKTIYLIDNTWYCVEVDVAYKLSNKFVYKLMENGTIN